MLPIVYAQTDEAIAEERRLLYVGVTRARDLICLSWALARSAGAAPDPQAVPVRRGDPAPAAGWASRAAQEGAGDEQGW